ncbi:hypothetical protein WR25_23443 [Diploscapter pachys]|uniref:RING-type E3 ubiquitin transferase (cysteine targeting) n=1 Tax=Diploscapter pachys TaxID=2018661 RepID=A0A2A2KQR6_9BILA|nr:hypothetical protein WR25_23443 [Diploscapter pachys]
MLHSECLRVDQLDANVLDTDIEETLHSQIDQLIQTVPVNAARYLERIRPELCILCDAALWTTRIYTGASPGQHLMDIRYKDYPNNKVFTHFTISILLPYFGNRLSNFNSNNQLLTRLVAKTNAMIEAFSILHHLHFLRSGGYSTLLEKFLDMRNWNVNPRIMGEVNYDTQNRELLWHTFRDALLLLWPLFRAAQNLYQRRYASSSSLNEPDATICIVCGEPATVPVKLTECSHSTCYWCATSGKGVKKECQICKAPSLPKMEFAKGTKIQ